MSKERSGAHWAKRFSGSEDTRDLSGTFRYAVEDFVAAMKAAGIRVSIDATYRPIKRSYLMYWCWRIVNDNVDPSTIPAMTGLDIEWSHASSAAIDMSISWRGTVSIKGANGKLVHIRTGPRSGINRQLIAVGATYGVKKYAGSGRDVPHWSNNGR